MALPKSHKSIFGIELALGKITGALISHDKLINSVAGDAVITIAAEITNVRAITIQLKDWKGKNLTVTEMIDIGLYLDATPTDFVATGGSTGIALGANGKLLTVLAKKLFRGITDATGKITLTWTDTGTEVFAIGVRLPGGRLVMSAAVANT